MRIKFSRSLCLVFISILILLMGGMTLFFARTGYDRSRVHPLIRDVQLPLKQLMLTPVPNGFLIEFVGADGQRESALLEFWNTPDVGHKVRIKIEPNGESALVADAYSDTSLALAALVNQYATPSKNRDEALYRLTHGKKYRLIGALHTAERKMFAP